MERGITFFFNLNVTFSAAQGTNKYKPAFMSVSPNNKFLELYEPVHTPFVKYCRAISGNHDDAQDLVQDTIVTVLSGFDKINDLSAFKNYLFSVAGNLHRKRLRKNKFTGEIDADELMAIRDMNQNPEAAADFRIMYDKMMKLPQKTSEALILFHISDLSLEDIQTIQGGSLSGVKLRLKRGREKLLKQLNEPAEVKAAVLFLNL